MELLPYFLGCGENVAHLQIKTFPNLEEFYIDHR